MARMPLTRAVPGRARSRPRAPAPRWLRARSFKRALRLVLVAPLAIRVVLLAALVVILWSAANWTYHVVRKPTELFFPVSGTLAKAPPETWRQYAPLFRRHSTATIRP